MNLIHCRKPHISEDSCFVKRYTKKKKRKNMRACMYIVRLCLDNYNKKNFNINNSHKTSNQHTYVINSLHALKPLQLVVSIFIKLNRG